MFIPIEFQKIKEKTTKSFFRIKASYEDSLSITSSKFAGAPYFPEGEKYPKDSEQNNLKLLAQINFAELPPNSIFPAKGILQFFIPQNSLTYGANLDNLQKSELAIRFWQNTTTSQKIEFIEDENHIFPIFGEHRLIYSKEEDAAAFESIEFSDLAEKNPIELLEDISLNESEAEEFYQSYHDIANLTGHKLLGNAFFPDYDPRKSNEWVLLLQIDSDLSHDNDIIWGDEGTAQFFIKKEDLEQHNFNNIFYFWHN